MRLAIWFRRAVDQTSSTGCSETPLFSRARTPSRCCNRSMEPSSTLRRPAFEWDHRAGWLRRADFDDEPAQLIVKKVRPPYPSQGPSEVCCAPQCPRPAAGRLAHACQHRPAPLPAASSCRIPLRPRPSPTRTSSHPVAHPGAIDARRQAAGAAATAPLVPYVHNGLDRADHGGRWPGGRRQLHPEGGQQYAAAPRFRAPAALGRRPRPLPASPAHPPPCRCLG